MIILAFETSCEKGSVALFVHDQCCSYELDGHLNHSEYVLDAVRRLLSEAQLSVSHLDAVAFGNGPGAFTGLRLSFGVVQGLALGAGLGVIPVSSLEALALQSKSERILVATDARMGEVYYACFVRQTGVPIEKKAAMCCMPADIQLPEGVWSGIGSAFIAYQSEFQAVFGKRLSDFEADKAPRAQDVARLAVEQVKQGRIWAPETVGLSYVRNKVAYTTAERLARGGSS